MPYLPAVENSTQGEAQMSDELIAVKPEIAAKALVDAASATAP